MTNAMKATMGCVPDLFAVRIGARGRFTRNEPKVGCVVHTNPTTIVNAEEFYAHLDVMENDTKLTELQALLNDLRNLKACRPLDHKTYTTMFKLSSFLKVACNKYCAKEKCSVSGGLPTTVESKNKCRAASSDKCKCGFYMTCAQCRVDPVCVGSRNQTGQACNWRRKRCSINLNAQRLFSVNLSNPSDGTPVLALRFNTTL
ncbi:conserved hypothetical protein [Culex quinquefasciatus]|uniref:Uncharacterized protein n=1 Tax=Culex quinquefasciatus TaxID=7176 RepID=B0VZ87_CULQU|nr:conserved hypothetical protein [Culex quinquefasciatus]|eukprot:XP_001841777.1 conserved hypothetical protein [Culex quinquefasciatus]